MQRLQLALASWKLWPSTEESAFEYGRIAAELRRIGRPIGQNDMMIAAIALTLGNCTVITMDGDFSAVPGLSIDVVILIAVPDHVVFDRMMNRRLCVRCGLDYNLIFHRPAQMDACDACGGQLVARADDTPEAIQTRLNEYHHKTEPILHLFRQKELVVVVDGTHPKDRVQEEIQRRLRLELRKAQID